MDLTVIERLIVAGLDDIATEYKNMNYTNAQALAEMVETFAIIREKIK